MTAVARRPRAFACLVLAATLALGACGGDDGDSEPLPVTSPSDITPEPEPGPTYGLERTEVEVSIGETFTIALKENQSTPYRWAVLDPEPDPRVVTLTDDRYESGGTEPGAGGTHSYTFRAASAGTTRFWLRHCDGCGTEHEKSEGADAVTFTITVRG
ncbi:MULTISPECIES: protease inhibitor I42 family protein [unclassified Streptomyces]|uniref:protease inhibitor I42 family protein n=1 Tax=unclassified Streptomyces TaxID=2593676 RepID=UPI0022B6717C|nr:MULTISPECIES: protease inhibitor I42 family protein [unclassified Streptomyces]MCZ7414142.1 protease inhibitor I42 family protein [Streptomyces sp. WMMC897]MCZ7431160.1 protease inhibitor I42 family protein [Streptomyces sp. WMMC1477]